MTPVGRVRLTERIRQVVDREGPVRTKDVADRFGIPFGRARTRLRQLDKRDEIHSSPQGWTTPDDGGGA